MSPFQMEVSAGYLAGFFPIELGPRLLVECTISKYVNAFSRDSSLSRQPCPPKTSGASRGVYQAGTYPHARQVRDLKI